MTGDGSRPLRAGAQTDLDRFLTRTGLRLDHERRAWRWTVTHQLPVLWRHEAGVLVFGERVGEAETRGEPAVIWNADTFTTASVDGLMAVQDDTNSYGYTWCLILRGVTAEDVPPGSIVTSALRDAYRHAV